MNPVLIYKLTPQWYMTISIESLVLTHNKNEVDNIIGHGLVCHCVSLINQGIHANRVKSNTQTCISDIATDYQI